MINGGSKRGIGASYQWGIRWVLSRLEEPEKCVDFISLILYTKVGERIGWKTDVAGVASYAFRSLTKIILVQQLVQW